MESKTGCGYTDPKPEVSEAPATYSPAGEWVCVNSSCDGTDHRLTFRVGGTE